MEVNASHNVEATIATSWSCVAE